MYSLVIVDYNSMDKTVQYVKKFLRKVSDREQIHIIIIDNADTSAGITILAERFGEYKIVKVENYKNILEFTFGLNTIIYYNSGENLGYAKGNNLGTQIADILFDDPYYIISNNDLSLTDRLDLGVFQKIFDHDSKIAVIGPRIIGLDGKEQSPHKKIGAIKYLILNYWLRTFPVPWKSDHDYTNENKRCYRVMGSFMIVRASAFCDVGRFDSETFMFAEEMILSERLAKKGYYFYFYNDYTVVHEHGTTVKKSASAIRAEKWAFQSCCYYYKKYRNTSEIIIFLAKVNFEVYIHIFPFITRLKMLKNKI